MTLQVCRHDRGGKPWLEEPAHDNLPEMKWNQATGNMAGSSTPPVHLSSKNTQPCSVYYEDVALTLELLVQLDSALAVALTLRVGSQCALPQQHWLSATLNS